MWRMRMRLLFGFLVLLALGRLPQERGVLAQKYYMNFAFNNNNPDGDGGGPGDNGGTGDNGGPHGHGDGGNSPGIGPVGGGEQYPSPDDGIGIGGGGGGGDVGEGGGDGGMSPDDGLPPVAGGDGDLNPDVGGELGENNAGYVDETGGTNKEHTPGHDDDNDDSDSKDAKDRRRKMAEAEHGKNKRTDHSHHSSYEISIDDSFGGRYVRSIYESSESHGHSGSRGGSNSRDSGLRRESSQEGREAALADVGPGNAQANVPDGTGGDAAAAQNDEDYEEM